MPRKWIAIFGALTAVVMVAACPRVPLSMTLPVVDRKSLHASALDYAVFENDPVPNGTWVRQLAGGATVVRSDGSLVFQADADFASFNPPGR